PSRPDLADTAFCPFISSSSPTRDTPRSRPPWNMSTYNPVYTFDTGFGNDAPARRHGRTADSTGTATPQGLRQAHGAATAARREKRGRSRDRRRLSGRRAYRSP